MIEQEVATVLTYCAAADPARFNTPDADQAQARVRVWLDLLGAVEPQFALDHVRRYYARHQDWPVTPGMIRTAWGHEVTRRESLARARALPPGGRAAGAPPGEQAAQVLATTREQIAANRAAYEETRHHPRPAWATPTRMETADAE